MSLEAKPYKFSEKPGKQNELLSQMMRKIRNNRDVFCPGELIEINRSDEDGEHVHIIVAPTKPIFSSHLLDKFMRDRILTKKQEKSLPAFRKTDQSDGGMQYPRFNFPVLIGKRVTEINEETVTTVFDHEAFKRRRKRGENLHQHQRITTNLENVITIHVFSSILAAKLAYGYWSKTIRSSPDGWNCKRSGLEKPSSNPYAPSLSGGVVNFLRKYENVELDMAARALEVLLKNSQ